MIELKGKKAIITGGAGGIGLAAARTFTKAGAEVIIADATFPTVRMYRKSLPPQTENWIFSITMQVSTGTEETAESRKSKKTTGKKSLPSTSAVFIFSANTPCPC